MVVKSNIDSLLFESTVFNNKKNSPLFFRAGEKLGKNSKKKPDVLFKELHLQSRKAGKKTIIEIDKEAISLLKLLEGFLEQRNIPYEILEQKKQIKITLE